MNLLIFFPSLSDLTCGQRRPSSFYPLSVSDLTCGQRLAAEQELQRQLLRQPVMAPPVSARLDKG
jgi:hypothetical protein